MSTFATFNVIVDDIIDFGQTAIGHRRMVPITGGTVSGEIGSGVILPGSDWQWVHADGTVSIDAHYSLKLDTGELVEVESRGTRFTDASGKVTFRTSIRLTTSANRADINQRMFNSVGTRLANEVILEITPVA